MMSFRATFMLSLMFALLGCTHTLHYNYPPPHPPSPVLESSSVQEPLAPAEQPSIEVNLPQIQEKPQETIQETQQEDKTQQVDKTVQKKVASKKKKYPPAQYEINTQVQLWIDRLSVKDRDSFQSALSRMDKIRPTMEKIFEQQGIPKDLVYLCLVESDANPHAVSCSGAVGYWQFIPDTAKKYGLQVNRYVDERKHLEKSTLAAAQYLKHLYAIFGDWYLAIAAYNAGEGAVLRLMKEHRIYTFWDIKNSMAIKPETIDFVPKYIATLTLAKNREAYGLRGAEPVKQPSIPEMVGSPGYVGDLARADGTLKGSLAQTNLENLPAPLSLSNKDKAHRNTEPSSTKDSEYQSDSTNQSAPYTTYTVHKGDTLYSLAKKHSITVGALAKANHLSVKQSLKVGKTVVIPVRAAHESAKRDSKQGQVHLVAKGETLKEISKEHGVPVDEIIRANNLKDPGLIQPKTALVIPSSQSKHALKKATNYKVKKGDTLWRISKQFDVSTMDILRWNKLTSTAEIKPGDKLTIYLQ